MKHLLFVILCGLCGTLTAADWPCWRGPSGGGSQPGFDGPLVDDVAKIRLLWKSDYVEDTFTGGYCSPLVADGKVYIAFYYGDGKAGAEEIANYLGTPGWHRKDSWKKLPNPEEMQKRRASPAADDVLVCLDAATGKTLWRFVSPSTALNHQRENTAHHGTPCVREGRVVWQGNAGQLLCVDAKTGALVWQLAHPAYQGLRDLRDQAVQAKTQTNNSELPWRHQPASCPSNVVQTRGAEFPWSAPVISNGKVVIGVRGNRVGKESLGRCWEAYDLATGAKAWTLTGHGGGGAASPLLWKNAGKEYIIGEGACIDPATGTVVWAMPAGEWAHTWAGTPALEGDLLVYGGGGAKAKIGPTGWRLAPTGPTRLWTRPPAESISANGTSPGLHRGVAYLYCCTGSILALDAVTGTELGRHDKFYTQGPSVVAIGDRVLFPHIGGAIDVFAAGKGFHRLGTFKHASALGKVVTPALTDGLMFTRGTDGVYCFDLRQEPVKP
jgi:outer membrane protein assembly factor BamB